MTDLSLEQITKESVREVQSFGLSVTRPSAYQCPDIFDNLHIIRPISGQKHGLSVTYIRPISDVKHGLSVTGVSAYQCPTVGNTLRKY